MFLFPSLAVPFQVHFSSLLVKDPAQAEISFNLRVKYDSMMPISVTKIKCTSLGRTQYVETGRVDVVGGSLVKEVFLEGTAEYGRIA